MRIGFFTNNYLPRKTGVSHSVKNFKQGLEEKGHEVFVFAPDYGDKKNERNVFRYPSLRPGFGKKGGKKKFFHSIPFPFSLTVRSRVKSLNLDLLHSHHPFLLGKEALKLSEKLDLPLVFTLHTPYHLYLDALPETLASPLKKVVLSFIISYINKSSWVVVPTKPIKKVIEHRKLTTPQRVIPSGVKLEDFRRKDEEGEAILQKYGVSPKTTVFLTVSRLTFEKNVDFTIKAFKRVVRSDPSVLLFVVGAGKDKSELADLACSLGIKNKIVFTGQINYDQIPGYYKAADVFVYSSLVDSQALVVAEAMAASLPVVALEESPGPSRLVQDKKTGYLCKKSLRDFSGACLELNSNTELRHRIAERAAQRAKKYSIESTTDKLLQLYKQVNR